MSKMELLYGPDEIARRVQAIASEIDHELGGQEVALVGILKGAAFLLVDLARALPFPVDFEFVDVTTSAGERGEVVNLTYATNFNLNDKHVLIIKDVFHTGVTENYLATHLSQQNPASMAVVALVDKPQMRCVNLDARFAVFSDVPEGHLVGYGLGSPAGRDANKPGLYLLREG